MIEDPAELNRLLAQENQYLKDQIEALKEKLSQRQSSADLEAPELAEKDYISGLRQKTYSYLNDEAKKLELDKVDDAQICLDFAKGFFLQKSKDHYAELKSVLGKLEFYEEYIEKHMKLWESEPVDQK